MIAGKKYLCLKLGISPCLLLLLTNLNTVDGQVTSSADNLRLELIYQEGVLALQNGDWLNAVIAFEKVKVLNPQYQDVQNKAVDAWFNLENSLRADSENDSPKANIFKILALSVVLVVLALSGVLLFYQEIRARFLLTRGNFEGAITIFESILQKNPEKLKIYPLLANLYLIENRNDESAIQVYEMTRRLNSLPNRQENINRVLARHYLKKGRSDAVAIEVMENELHARLLKTKTGQTGGFD